MSNSYLYFASVRTMGIASSLALFLLACLASTIVIELILAIFFKVRGKNLLVVLLAQIITNPLLVLISNLVYYLLERNIVVFYVVLVVLELIAIFVEGVLYRDFFKKYKRMNPFMLSLWLNLFSFLIGVVGCISVFSTL